MAKEHALSTLGNRHAIHNWEVADATARDALVVTTTDVGKIAWKQDDNTFWFLADDSPMTWEELSGGGGGAVSSVNGQTGAVVLDADDIDDTATVNKFADATSVEAAGAVMVADTITTGMGFVIDEDDMISDLDTKVPTQQSVKAYVDAAVLAAGSYTDEQAQDAVGAMTVDSSSIDVTYDDVANTLSLAVIDAYIDALVDAKIAAINGGEVASGTNWYLTHRVSVLKVSNSGASTITNIGTGTASLNGTASNGDDTDGNWVNLLTTTVINNIAGVRSNNTWRADWGITMTNRFKTGADSTLIRHWVAMSSTSLVTQSDTPTAHLAGFRFSTAVPDTNWQCCTSDNTGTLTITDSGVPFAINTDYDFKVVFGSAVCNFYINNNLVATHTLAGGDKMPGTTNLLEMFNDITTLSAAARSFKFGQSIIATLN